MNYSKSVATIWRGCWVVRYRYKGFDLKIFRGISSGRRIRESTGCSRLILNGNVGEHRSKATTHGEGVQAMRTIIKILKYIFAVLI